MPVGPQIPRVPSGVSKRELREQLQIALARDHGIKAAHLSLNDCVLLALEHGLSARPEGRAT